MSIISNKAAFIKHVQAAAPALDAKMTHIMQWTIETMHHSVLSMTPVWSGSAVANYQWSVGVINTGLVNLVDNGPPGPTNSMPLGPEPRRQPNEALADASHDALIFVNPYQTFWLNNNDPDIIGLEYGLLPDPARSRSRQGMVYHSLELARYVLHSML